MESQSTTAPAGEWEAQAAAAGERAAELETKLKAAEAELGRARAELTATERRHALQRELVQAGALDLDVAAFLAEAAVAGQEKPDIAGAIADVRRRKPYLFRAAPRSGVMGPGGAEPPAPLEDAAAAARTTGDRRALLRYLRLRRNP